MDVMDPEIYSYMGTPKVQICDDLMIVANGNCVPIIHGPEPESYVRAPGGITIYSLKEDPEHPRKLSFWATNAPKDIFDGVHLFCYNGGRYVHLSASAPGFLNYIYRILDIADPKHPVEVGRWWNPGFVHCVYVTEDNKAYLSCGGVGFKILDVSDPARPQVLGEVPMSPPFSTKFGGALCHTFMLLLGRNYAVGLQEGERFWCVTEDLQEHFGVQSMCGIEMFDVSDPEDPVMISVFPYPEVPEDFPYQNFNYCGLKKPGPFGPHNIHEPMTNKPWIEDNPNRVYDCYFHAGLRVYDVSDPYVPKEIAYFIPPNPEKLCFEIDMPNTPLGTAEDLVVDDRGYIFMNAMHDGVYILRCLV